MLRIIAAWAAKRREKNKGSSQGALRRAEDARSSTPSPAGWRDIGSAPRDGTYVDLWAKAYGRKPHMCWNLVNRYRVEGWTDDWYGRGSLYAEQQFTHWMPEPPPPSGSAEGVAAPIERESSREEP